MIAKRLKNSSMNIMPGTCFKNFALIALAFALLAAPAAAGPGKDPQINVVIPDFLKGVSEEYKAAYDKFSPEQKAQLDEAHKENVSTLEPDIEIISRAAYLEPCQKLQLFNQQHGEKFIKFRDHQNVLQDRLRADFKKTYVDPVTFIDRSLLMRHLALEQVIQMQMVAGMSQLAQKTTPEEKVREKCVELMQYLDGYVAQNKL